MSQPLQVQWAGAELAASRWQGPHLHLRLAVAPVSSSGGQHHPDSWYLRGVDVVLLQAHLDGPLADAVGRVQEAELRIDGQACRAMTVDQQQLGQVSLQLVLSNGTVLSVRGQGLQVRPPDQPEPVAHLHC